ncbi:warA [Symbiodinium natans]|uniref:WarA protein n=1 Tax=Symbiodinium natans TaxID=878477 RepID=A0A812VFZ4_9DINO|nr:warA [Symbiodinium natans]
MRKPRNEAGEQLIHLNSDKKLLEDSTRLWISSVAFAVAALRSWFWWRRWARYGRGVVAFCAHVSVAAAALLVAAAAALELLALGADSGSRTLAGAAPLHTVAALPGTAVSGVLSLLQQKSQVAVSATDMRGRTPVHYAAASGDWDNVQWLVAQGADIQAKDSDGLSPLEVGLANGHYHLVPLFETLGSSVLFAAAGFGNVSLVQQLVLQNGMSPNAIDDQTGRTPIFEAVEKARIDVAEFPGSDLR